MRNERMMNVAMVVGIVMLTWSNQLMTSSAQPGCWERIITCIEAVETNAEVQQECCPIVLQEISNERECFCSIKPLVAQNASLSTDLSNLLSLCSVTTSFQVICPVQSKDTETAACWDDISHCVEENVNTSATDPNFDPTSPSFNMSEFLCCPLIHETAIVEKECFCTVNTFIQQFPVQAANVSFLLTA
ncbi:DnaJ-like protein subfamily C GRV2, partial [Bienertia sinuspersici]